MSRDQRRNARPRLHSRLHVRANAQHERRRGEPTGGVLGIPVSKGVGEGVTVMSVPILSLDYLLERG